MPLHTKKKQKLKEMANYKSGTGNMQVKVEICAILGHKEMVKDSYGCVSPDYGWSNGRMKKYNNCKGFETHQVCLNDNNN
jgi:hypothetical protein